MFQQQQNHQSHKAVMSSEKKMDYYYADATEIYIPLCP